MSLFEQYDKQRTWRWFDFVLDQLGAMDGKHVADVGCGAGAVAETLIHRGARVTAIDNDAELLEQVGKKLGNGCKTICADFNQPQMWSQVSFDVIWSSFAIAYAADPVATLRCWGTLLPAGSSIALVEMSNLLGHRPMNAEDRRAVESFYIQTRARRAYDFEAGVHLAYWVSKAGYDIQASGTLPDDELSFSGAARAEVLEAWMQRLARMPRLIASTPPGFTKRFLESLSSSDHVCDCTVHYVIGMQST